MKPVVGSGFGTFGRVLGPWTDYFPTQTLPADSQFGVCLATEIPGGSKGATITALTAEIPFNTVGNNGNVPWRLMVIRGSLPNNVKQFQESDRGWPRVGESDLAQVQVLFSKIFGAKTVVNSYSSSTLVEQELHFPFPDMSGPSVGPGEMMTVLFVPMFNETGVPGYGANNKSYVAFSVYGVGGRRTNVDGNRDTTGRSVPRGVLG